MAGLHDSGLKLRAHAVALGDRIAVKDLSGERVSAVTVLIPAGSGAAFVFRYGCVVFFDLDGEERQGVLARVLSAVRDPFSRVETEDSEWVSSMDGIARFSDRELVLPDKERATLQVVADVLAKSVALSHYESKIAEAFDKIEPLAQRLKQTGRIGYRSGQLVQQIAGSLLTQHRVIGRIEIAEKPDLLWENSSLERLHAWLVDDYELRERAAAFERKLQLISNTAEILLNMLQNRRALRVEWYIVLLIMLEIGLSLWRR